MLERLGRPLPMIYMHGREWLQAAILWTPRKEVDIARLGDLVLVRRPGETRLYQGYVADLRGEVLTPVIRVFDKAISEWFAWPTEKAATITPDNGCVIEYIGGLINPE